MNKPFTLLSLAASQTPAASLSNASIVVIDAQNEYREGSLSLDGVEPALSQIAHLLKRARAAGTPIIHIRHAGAPGKAFDLTEPRGQIAEAAQPAPGESVIDKPLPNSFAKTELHAVLGCTGRNQLIVVGFMTHMCVSSTVRAALDLGYSSTVIAAATATRALPGAASGPIVASAALQQATLAALGDRFATVLGEVGELFTT